MSEKKEFAPGIPDKDRFEPLPTVTKAQVWKAIVHGHQAFRAGSHLDLRLGQPKSDNLHSWALRRMPKPGEKVLAVLQPTHSMDYSSFEGVIPKGYGAGSVRILHKEKAIVNKSEPGKITFQMKGQLFTLVQPKQNKKNNQWLLLNRTKLAMGAGGGGGAGGDGMTEMAMAGKLKGTAFQKTVKELEHGGKRHIV